MKAALIALAALGCASTPYAIVVPVRVDPAVRDAIAVDWPPPVETLRCVSYRPYGTEPHQWFVTGVQRVRNTDATQWRVRGECPDSTVAVHDHLPVTCEIGALDIITCRPGGVLAHLCAPSENDRRYLANRKHQPFNGVRCDARAIVFYRVR